MKEWKRIEPTIVSKVGYRTVVSKSYQMPNGKTDHFEVVEYEGWQAAAVLGLTDDNRVIVVRQFRVGPEMIMDELPGGIVDPGEDKAVAARREFEEETGYVVGELTFLGTMHYDAWSNGKRHCFLATGCKPSGKEPERGEHEFIELDLITIDQLLENARQGKMTDPGVVLLAYDELQKRRVKE